MEAEKIENSGGYRYLKARRPNLYSQIITQKHTPDQQLAWLHQKEE